MDQLGLTDRLCEMDESDLNDIYNFHSQHMELDDQDLGVQQDDANDLPDFEAVDLNLENYDEAFAQASSDWMDLFVDPVVNDKMMSEASNPLVKSEHSYSVGKNTDDAELSTSAALGNPTGHATHTKILETTEPRERTVVKIACSQPTTRPMQTISVVKQEPRIIMKNEPIIIEARRPQQQKSLLKPQAILLTKPANQQQTRLANLVPKREATVTHTYTIDSDEGIYLNVMPMTPPGSSSDSDGGLSPMQSPTPSPIRQYITKSSHREINPATAIYSQPIPTSGVLVLTEEEKRTLISEGYPIPSKLPLSKMEEKNLKKVRRKIKNKISAQESRRKRKEYMDHLEKKMEDINRENNELRRKCDQFESSNSNLMSQLGKLQNIVKRIAPQQATQAGVCVMVLVMCFAVFFGTWSPNFGLSMLDSTAPSDPLSVSSFSDMTMRQSRTLLAMSEEEQSCGNEPWPLMLARKSYESISSLIAKESDVATAGTNVSSQRVFVQALDSITA